MDYQNTLLYLYNSVPMFQQVGSSAYKEGLENTLALDEHFGHPHRNFHSIHVGGTEWQRFMLAHSCCYLAGSGVPGRPLHISAPRRFPRTYPNKRTAYPGRICSPVCRKERDFLSLCILLSLN